MTSEATTMKVYEYLRSHPGASMDEMAHELGISSRSNVRYHLLKLAERKMVDFDEHKHRSFRVTEREG
jgi:predicted ArsR family transcriptional regulator